MGHIWQIPRFYQQTIVLWRINCKFCSVLNYLLFHRPNSVIMPRLRWIYPSVLMLLLIIPYPLLTLPHKTKLNHDLLHFTILHLTMQRNALYSSYQSRHIIILIQPLLSAYPSYLLSSYYHFNVAFVIRISLIFVILIFIILILSF